MISVIIPTYNRSQTIERSIRSVLNQTYGELECIVVDDGSTDNTAEIVQSISDDRLKYYKLDHNSGACVARNKGIDLAVGDYIAFQDSDDEWLPEKIEIQLHELQLNNADVCFCSRVIHSKTGDFSFTTQHELTQGFIDKRKLYLKSLVSTQTIFARRKVFESCRFDENVKKAQDYEWTIRASEMYTFYFVAEPLANQYMQKVSITANTTFDYQARMENDEYLYHKFENYYADNIDLQITLLKRYVTSKTLAGYDASAELKELCRISHDAKSYLKYVMSKLGILRRYLLYKQEKSKMSALLK